MRLAQQQDMATSPLKRGQQLVQQGQLGRGLHSQSRLQAVCWVQNL